MIAALPPVGRPPFALSSIGKIGGAQRELVADQVGHLPQPRRGVEEDADLAGDELLARLVPVDQRHAVLGDEATEALQRAHAEIGAAERYAVAVDDHTARLRDHRVVQPHVRPVVDVVREARDVGAAGPDLRSERHHRFPVVGHPVGIAARFFTSSTL